VNHDPAVHRSIDALAATILKSVRRLGRRKPLDKKPGRSTLVSPESALGRPGQRTGAR
jgi:hypothetical protein